MKKTLTSLALLSSITAGSWQSGETLFNVSQEIHQEVNQIVSTTNHSIKERFEKLVSLAEQIGDLNGWLENRSDVNLTHTDLKALMIVNDVLDFTFYYFKSRYENQIYNAFTQEFRIFSSKRNIFKSQLKQLNDELNGITIVEVEGLKLTDDDIAQISISAKALEKRILNAC